VQVLYKSCVSLACLHTHAQTHMHGRLLYTRIHIYIYIHVYFFYGALQKVLPNVLRFQLPCRLWSQRRLAEHGGGCFWVSLVFPNAEGTPKPVLSFLSLWQKICSMSACQSSGHIGCRDHGKVLPKGILSHGLWRSLSLRIPQKCFFFKSWWIQNHIRYPSII
jgi:hypothetical protein